MAAKWHSVQELARIALAGTGPANAQMATRLTWLERGMRHAALGVKPMQRADVVGVSGTLAWEAYLEGWRDATDSARFSERSRAPRGGQGMPGLGRGARAA